MSKIDMENRQTLLVPKNIWDVNDKELLNLLIGRDGGKTTMRIIDSILNKPYNKNQLAKKLNVDYNTITHHIEIIHNHKYIRKEKFDNVTYYHPSEKLFKSIAEYNFIKEYIKNRK